MSLTSLLSFLSTPLYYLYDWIFVLPLSKLYYHGPELHGYGFWNGAASEDICAMLTGTPSQFWAVNTQECGILVERHFCAFLTAAYFILYSFLIYRLFSEFWVYMFVTRPIIGSMRELATTYNTNERTINRSVAFRLAPKNT